jgi:hypothetical protein
MSRCTAKSWTCRRNPRLMLLALLSWTLSLRSWFNAATRAASGPFTVRNRPKAMPPVIKETGLMRAAGELHVVCRDCLKTKGHARIDVVAA